MVLAVVMAMAEICDSRRKFMVLPGNCGPVHNFVGLSNVGMDAGCQQNEKRVEKQIISGHRKKSWSPWISTLEVPCG